MSHHFDTPTGREDPRINVCDFYLFGGRPGMTVMAMTVNADAGISAPETFRDEGVYAFRFDLNGDAREEVTFKVLFGPVVHADGDDHKHVQKMQVLRATGGSALKGIQGEVLVEGRTGEIAKGKKDVLAFAGLAPDLFAGDGAALGKFRNALFKENKFDPDAFLSRKNFFENRNVTAIVIEVPTELIGRGKVHAWTTVSLYGHAPEMQVSRWGLPLITNAFIPDMDMREQFNRGVPADDVAHFGGQIGGVGEKLSGLAGSAAIPSDYGKQLVARLLPATLPYELGTPAAFDFVGFNGRGLADDAMDVILTLATNTALGDGVAPDKSRISADFPYFGTPYTAAEQTGISPAVPPSKK
jgi:Domain of unknown function (DUF4331)